MAKCPQCGGAAPLISRDLATGYCAKCLDAQKQATANAIRQQQRVEAEQQKLLLLETQKKRMESPLAEPIDEPIDGLVLVGISIAIGVVGGVVATQSAIAGFVFIGIASMVYLAGIIRWGVSGCQFIQGNRLQRQNIEIIELLKRIASNK